MGKRRKIGFLARVLMYVAAGLLFLSYFSVLINPKYGWVLAFTGLLFIPLLLLNVLFLLWGIKRRSATLLIPLVACLPSLLFIGEYVRIGGKQETAAEPSVKVISYNVGRFEPGRRKGLDTRQACMDSVFRFLKGQDADVICLQEFYLSDNSKNIDKLLLKYFPGYSNVHYTYLGKKSEYGNVTLSRLPLAGKGSVRFDESANLAIYSDLSLGGKTVRVYNCHLQSYNIPLLRLVKSLGRDKELLKETGEKMKISALRRPSQVEKILNSFKDCPYEVMVCGDFNDTPLSYTYYKLSKGRKDSFEEAGRGFAATYSVLWPLLRIDYVLYPSFMKAVSHKSPHKKYSDHYPVIVEFK